NSALNSITGSINFNILAPFINRPSSIANSICNLQSTIKKGPSELAALKGRQRNFSSRFYSEQHCTLSLNGNHNGRYVAQLPPLGGCSEPVEIGFKAHGSVNIAFIVKAVK
ncbi:MAG: hypothetical protein ACYSSK_07650, partial [Planctomycetota bacterium]